MARQIRVLVAGDDGVGKSSIVFTLVSRSFPENPPPVVHDITLPPELYFENAEVTLMDSSPRDEEDLNTKLTIADCIILVYSVDDDATFEHLGEYWLPLIEEKNSKTTVFIAGNKADTNNDALGIEEEGTEERKGDGAATDRDPGEAYLSLVERVEPLLQRFRFIVDFIHVSAACEVALSELFFKAIDSVVNPISPLFDVQSADLKPEAVYAIHRLFRCYDQDMDSLLNKAEMSKIQRRCFNLELEDEDLESLRQVVVGEGRGGLVTEDGFTVEGLTTLCRHFVEENKAQVVWKMLRQIGFDTDLHLVPPTALSSGLLSNDSLVFQLTAEAWHFLDSIFTKFDTDVDGLLDAADVAEIFSVLPSSIRGRSPWSNPSATTLSLDAPEISARQWRAYWAQTVSMSPVVAAQKLFYLGYLGDDFNAASDTTKYFTALPAPKHATMTQRRRRLGIGYGLSPKVGRGLPSVTIKVLLLSPDKSFVTDTLKALSLAPGCGECCKISTNSWPHDVNLDVDGPGNPETVGFEYRGDREGAAEPLIHVVFSAAAAKRQTADLVLLLYEEASEDSITAALNACDALPPWQGLAFIRKVVGMDRDAEVDSRIQSKCLRLGIPLPFVLHPDDTDSAADAANGIVMSVLKDEHMPRSLARVLARTIASTPTWYSAIIALAVGGLIAAVGYELWRQSKSGEDEASKESPASRTAAAPSTNKMMDGSSVLEDSTLVAGLPGDRFVLEERPKLCQLPSRHPYLLLFAEWAGTLGA